MAYINSDLIKEMCPIISVIPRDYVDVILTLHEKIGDNAKWVLNGNLAECLRTVQIEPDEIEIVTSKCDAEKILRSMQEYNPGPMNLQVLRLPRYAVIGDQQYPVYTKSHGFEFNLKSVRVRVQGDLQYRVNDWDWGDIFDFTPEYVYVVGKKTAVTPLSIAAEFYQTLGWIDRADKIKRVLQRPLHLKEQH